MAAGYIIALRKKLTDKEEFKVYGKKAFPTIAKAKIDILYGKHEVLEGEPLDGVVVFHFDSYDEARTWYYSDEYQAAIKHRLASSDFDLILVEGHDAA